MLSTKSGFLVNISGSDVPEPFTSWSAFAPCDNAQVKAAVAAPFLNLPPVTSDAIPPSTALLINPCGVEPPPPKLPIPAAAKPCAKRPPWLTALYPPTDPDAPARPNALSAPGPEQDDPTL